MPLGGWESRASPAVGCAQARRHTHFGYIPPGSLHYISLERLNAGIMPERYYTTARDVPVWTKIAQALRLSAELPWWESKILLGKIFCTNPHCQRRVICWHLEGAQTLGIILFGLRNFVSFCINGIAYQAAHLPNETRTTEPWLRNRLADARATFCAAAQFTEHGGMR